MTTILGVSCFYHDSAAAVVRGGDILGAVQEERFTRRKADNRLPAHSIAWCLERAGGADSIDAIAFYEDPVLSLDRVHQERGREGARYKGCLGQRRRLAACPEDQCAAGSRRGGQRREDEETFPRRSSPVSRCVGVFSVAFHRSGNRRARWHWRMGVKHDCFRSQHTIELRRQIHYPHSLGLFIAHSRITAALR